MALRLPFWGTVLTITGVCVLCSLGTWQMARLQWKQSLIQVIEAEYALDASEVSLSEDALVKAVLFKRGHIAGVYQHDKEIKISSRVHKSVPGYHIVTPFILDNGASILVNRGWIPIEAERGDDYAVARAQGRVVLVGGMRAPHKPSSFVPQNKPERDVWYRLDIEQVADVKGMSTVSPNIFYVEQRAQKSGEAYPIIQHARLKLNNNHAQYAIFWFTMAFMMCVVYVFRFIVPQYRKHSLS